MRVPLFDLQRVVHPYLLSLNDALDETIKSCAFINGPPVKEFERDFAAYLRTEHAIGVSSGTDALLAIFMSLGLSPGDEVLVTPFTFVASASSILRAGLKPVFVDVAANSFHPSAEQYARATGPKTKAILLVHLFGIPNDMDAITAMCRDHNLLLVEDCAQSLGTEWKGQKVGTFGDASAFSFFPAKNLGCFGDGGAIATNNSQLAETIRTVRSHGAATKYNTEMVGGNFRLDTIQAAVLKVLLPALPEWINKRQENATYYLNNIRQTTMLNLPESIKGHSWNQFTLLVSQRDELKQHLDKNGIGNAIYYPTPLHKQPLFMDDNLILPNVESLCKQVLSIPVYPGLTEEEREFVVQTINSFEEQR
jgi:dTDP-4-amino-4,6-dideoxygalactose transaminase